MATILAQIAPQKSTQYAALADALAPYELELCPLGEQMTDIAPIQLAGQKYLRFNLPDVPTPQQAHELGLLAMTTAFFVYYDKLGRIKGPLLRPIETQIVPSIPPDIMMTRRYRGKTNELFTHFMCNIARFGSALAHRPWNTLRVFDPLAGGGTTLFTAMVLGADVAGVEHDTQDVKSTAAFLKQYLSGQNIPFKVKEERLKKVGKRWTFTTGASRSQERASPRCILACGDTIQSPSLISGFRPHLIVADLPYGIQHKGELVTLLSQALPVWASLLPLSGTIVFAWESRRLPRDEMIALVESTSPLTVLNEPPYNMLAHRVDRVIKQRDVLVARLTQALQMDRSNAS
jgi:hypothetical protein